MVFSKSTTHAVAAAVVFSLLLTSCRRDDVPVDFEFSVPAENSVRFAAELKRRYGLGLQGEFQIDRYGSIFVEPETPNQGFKFGFELHTSVFRHDTWVNYREVTSLPTGAPFPMWMTGPVVDVVIPPLNHHEVNWHFYFGTRGQYYVGLAAVIRAVNQNFPGIDIGYTFYDDQGRVILGIQFFGPKVAGGGQLLSPGGIFVGTNVTPFLPEDFQPAHASELGGGVADTSDEIVRFGPRPRPRHALSRRHRALARRAPVLQRQALELVERANRGEQVRINGQTVYGEVRVTGRDARRYRSERSIRRAISQFTAASRQAN